MRKKIFIALFSAMIFICGCRSWQYVAQKDNLAKNDAAFAGQARLPQGYFFSGRAGDSVWTTRINWEKPFYFYNNAFVVIPLFPKRP
jgi:hypothetical protein